MTSRHPSIADVTPDDSIMTPDQHASHFGPLSNGDIAKPQNEKDTKARNCHENFTEAVWENSENLRDMTKDAFTVEQGAQGKLYVP